MRTTLAALTILLASTGAFAQASYDDRARAEQQLQQLQQYDEWKMEEARAKLRREQLERDRAEAKPKAPVNPVEVAITLAVIAGLVYGFTRKS